MSLLIVKQKISTIPTCSGVYLFKNKENIVLYIGKAKNLKKRISNYFREKVNLWTVQMLQIEANDFEYFVTKSEHSALILEAELIKKYQPKFNTLLKDGQPALYFLFNFSKRVPDFKIVRTRKEAGEYIGPFLNAKMVRSVFDVLQRKLKLSLCNSKIDTGCLEYHIGICAGNCKLNFNLESYRFRVKLAFNIIKNKSSNIIKEIDNQIQKHISKQEFEEAKDLVAFKGNIDNIKVIIKDNFETNKIISELTYKVSKISKITISPNDYAQQIKELLSLELAPNSIDCFDISHFQSREIVGSCIRFIDGKPEKKSFRRFKIKSLIEQNDYAALAEIVSRRYRNGDYPDLILIDGGIGQLNAVKDLVGNTQIVSLAKKEELIFKPGKNISIPLNIHTSSGKLLIGLRDYAHHFAISYHRLRRDRLA